MAESKKKETKRARLNVLLKDLLGQRATVKLLKEVEPDLLREMSAGAKAPTMAELLVKKVVKLALDPEKPNQWAVELIFDRVEGKPVGGAPPTDDGRQIEERLDDVTTQHLNAIASQFSRRTPGELAGGDGEPAAEAGADGPAAKLLDLPQDRPARPQGDDDESPVEAGASQES
jgi:hypothetical protein